ncbi:tyrosine-type recombinase/integrase [Candidatus Mycobacterium methanotrophicum]|uniref:Tyrosine-type recombinase/integrase n=1 Tax=Candidatus Mycobacterium methanotrophicum TaxID=2943498 RepID=A0ABY4QJ51_9MYCO|nr:tyrosine-type recombinase/integrase [Candidatus Mycobacterium methanotrophicum]UQX09834.1 tyrosine-type recombinase/integrase [Candidatus Mycobacterium methanotrophicum]
MDQFMPCLIRHHRGSELAAITPGHPLLDDYLAFVAARARTNAWLAVASDLKIFFGVVAKEPTQVNAADVFAFLAFQRTARLGERVVRLEDGEPGLAARTIARRLSSVRGLYAYLAARGDTGVSRNPVPTSLAARRPGARRGKGGMPLIRTPRTLPRVLVPSEVDALRAALRTHRDRAMVEAMLLGGLRRCEVLGLRLDEVNAGERRVFVAEGKGGRQRMVPVSARFFASLGDYLDQERPRTSSDRVFVVLKGSRRGQPLSAAGLDEILDGARARAGLRQATCHQLRHTCFTRLREAGMALEAIQAQAGHRSMRMTLVYARIADRTVADEYFSVSEKVEALYDQPRALPADAEGAEMRKLRAEMHRRMLGNGYCARPVGLDCHFESICESCTFFQTTIEFGPPCRHNATTPPKKDSSAARKCSTDCSPDSIKPPPNEY